MADTVRLARTLGVPRASFLHPSAPVPRAYQDPDVLLLSHATATLEPKDREALRNGLVRAGSFAEVIEHSADLPLLSDDELFRVVAAPTRDAHLSGYKRAQHARSKLAQSLPARAPVDKALCDPARLIEDHFGILVIDLSFATPHVAEASCRRGPARLIAIDPRQPETSRRWALAHGLAHQLLDLQEEDALQEENDDRFSFEKKPREQRADAFAAMFLAPREAVDAILLKFSLKSPKGLGEARQAVQECRRALGLNFVPMARQLQDLGVISKGDADTLVDMAGTEVVGGFEEPRQFDGLARWIYQALSEGWISRGRALELDPTINPA